MTCTLRAQGRECVHMHGNKISRNLHFGCTTLEAVCVLSKVMLAALCTHPVPRLDFNPWLLKTIPTFLHEEARPVLSLVLGGPLGVGGPKV